MSKKSTLSLELRNAIIWLERQPGVTSVTQGRYTTARHHQKPGFTRVAMSDKKSVLVRVYDAKGTKDLFVYAPPSALRDKWVAQLVNGEIISTEPTSARKIKTPEEAIPKSILSPTVPTPAAVDEKAGQLFDVTPDLAAKWLERNTRNRGLNQAVVLRYAADMKAGHWMVTGDAISFDTNGAIVNGQHRLWAVLESGLTVRMLVAFGLSPDVVNVLDDHLKRSLKDVAKIGHPGSKINSTHTGTSNSMLWSLQRATSTDPAAARARTSRQTQLDFLMLHMPAIEFVVRECWRSQHPKGLAQSNIMAPVARAFYTQDKARLMQFGQVMLTGMTETKDDMAAIMLRNWILRQVGQGVKSPGETVYKKTERALQAFLEREHLQTLYESSTELFPLPEEKRPGNRNPSRSAK